MIPAIKKELRSFILEEKGGAQKQVLISLGAMLAGLDALNVVSHMVTGANISSKHDHCDPGHSSGHSNGASGYSGWHGSGTSHSNADGVPSSHCNDSAHGSNSHRDANAAHGNNIVLNYG
ncbi:MAG: hypothetical protein JW727_02805 [Candidatus Aenigmarchaeota archaeon]|nr:hypothetical protein [Candidatus Aenigmarchaeota archaeon]